MSDKIVVGTCDGEEYRFHECVILFMGLTKSGYDVQTVADTLAANVECPDIEDDGTVDIECRSNFNDAYFDMVADLRGED